MSKNSEIKKAESRMVDLDQSIKQKEESILYLIELISNVKVEKYHLENELMVLRGKNNVITR